MPVGSTKELTIYIDESGQFWNNKPSKDLSVVSFSWRSTDPSKIPGVDYLEAKLRELGHSGMFHTAPLIHGSGEKYSDLDVAARRHVFWAFFYFIERSDINCDSIIIDTKYHSTPEAQKIYLLTELESKLRPASAAFLKYSKIHLYYDDGQPELTNVLNQVQANNSSIELHISGNHKKSRVFQAADYATFIDRLVYKIDHGIPLSKTEERFFNAKALKLIQRSRQSKMKGGLH